jgi:DHA1 family bicyclomycin/chloramphenicol resistance-like MFS transporter
MRRPESLTPWLLAVLGFVSAVAPLSTDMYLASFTAIAGDLGTDAARVQLTLTAFLIGLGAGQLLLGPLSDRWGRRPILVSAVGVFAAAGVAMVFAPSIESLIALRTVQGFSGAGSIVVARAIAADLSTGSTAVRALSVIAMVTALGPLLAPPIGGVVDAVVGWRGVLGVLGGAGILMLILSALVVPESLPARDRQHAGLRSSFGSFGTLLRDPGFVAYIAAFGLAFGAMMSYISASPFVGQSILGMTPLQYSLTFAAGGTALITANLVNARVAPRVGPQRMVLVGVGLLVLAGTAMLALVLTGSLSRAAFVACAFTLTAGTGFTLANVSALALARTDRSSRGAGSALLGACQFGVGGALSPVVGLWGEHTAVPMAVATAASAVCALALVLVARRRS